MKTPHKKHSILMLINITLGLGLGAFVITMLLPRGNRSSGANTETPANVDASNSQSASPITRPLPAETTAAPAQPVVASHLQSEQPHTAEPFAKSIEPQLRAQTRMLLDELDEARLNGNTNNGIVLSEERIREIEEKGEIPQ